MSCDHVTGEFSCRPGYIGPMCQHPCPNDTYGPNCQHSCDCKNGDCHHVTGDYSIHKNFLLLLFLDFFFIVIYLFRSMPVFPWMARSKMF